MDEDNKVDCLKEALIMCGCLKRAIQQKDEIEHQLHDIMRIVNWIKLEIDRR